VEHNSAEGIVFGFDGDDKFCTIVSVGGEDVVEVGKLRTLRVCVSCNDEIVSMQGEVFLAQSVNVLLREFREES